MAELVNYNRQVNTDIYYNGSTLLSKNALINFVVGERGNGKTYFFKKWCIKDFLKNGAEFIWLRRYDTEFDDISLFFNDIAHEFPNVEFKVGKGKFYINDKVAGYFFPLSKHLTKKSIPYPNVTKIIFDEFIIPKGNYHYLPKEVDVFFETVETIARLRDVRCFLIANAVTEINPYFTYFNLKLEGRFTRVGDICVEKTDSADYRQVKKDTRFGKLISKTEYGKYAIENEFVNDNHEFIEKRTQNAKIMFNISINNKLIGIWCDYKEGKLYASFKTDAMQTTVCFTNDEMKPNYLMLNSRSNNIKTLKNAISYGYLYYESFKVKTYMLEVIKLLAIK